MDEERTNAFQGWRILRGGAAISDKALCVTVFVFAILVFGGNHLAVSRLIANQEQCDCKQLSDLVADVSNSVYLRRRYRDKIRDLRKLTPDKAADDLNRFVKLMIQRLKSPECYKGPANVEYTPFGRRLPAYSLGRYTNEQLCEPSDSSKQALAAAKRGSCCEADAAATEAHERYYHDKCAGMGYKNYEDMSAADRAAEEAEAYGTQIAAECREIKAMSCPDAPNSTSQRLKGFCP